MHIALVTETWPPQINGVAATVHAMAAGLAQRQHHIEVIRPGTNGRDAGVRIELVGTRAASVPRYPGLRVGLPHGWKLRRRWSTHRPDAVYIATEGPLGWSALRVANALRIPVATGFHTRFDDYAMHYGVGWLKPLVRAHLLRFHRRAQATIVPTRALATELQADGILHAQRICRGVDTALFSPLRRDDALRQTWRVRGDAPVLLYVGRIAAEKNLDVAVKAFRTLQARVPDARMVMVGDGPLRARLTKDHADIVFTGELRGESLARHYASADMFLFPSLTETFGNVVLEALASGLPVVAYHRAAAQEHVTNGISGLVVPSDDARGFISSTYALGLDAKLRATLAINARIAAQRLTPDDAIAGFESLLRGLCRERTYEQLLAVHA